MIRNTVARHIFYRLLLGASVLFGSISNFVVYFVAVAEIRDADLCAGFGMIFLLPGSFGLWYGCRWFFSAFFWMLIRDQHPWIKPLHEFGEPFAAIESIESDIKAGPLETWGEPFSFAWANVKPAIVLSPNWLIHFRKTSSVVIPLSDILWIYQQHGRHKNWWGGATDFRTVLIYAIRRGPYLLDLGAGDGARWLGERLVERRPDVLFGDSDEYRDLEKDGVEAIKDYLIDRQEQYRSMSTEQKKDWRKDALDDYLTCVHAWEI